MARELSASADPEAIAVTSIICGMRENLIKQDGQAGRVLVQRHRCRGHVSIEGC